MNRLLRLFDLSTPEPRLERPSSAFEVVLTLCGGAGLVLLLFLIATVATP